MADSQTTTRAPPGVALKKLSTMLVEDINRGCEKTKIDIHLVSALLHFAMGRGAVTVGDLQ